MLERKVKEKAKEEEEQAQTEPLSTGGSGGAITGTSKSAPSTNKNKPTNSGSFTNIQDYVNANQGNSEAFADQTINTLNEGVDSAMNTAQAEVDSYRDAVTAGTVVDNEELRGTDLTDIANDPDKLAEYQAGLNATYGGPDAFVSEQGFSDIDQTSGVINRTDNFSGMNSALQDTYGQYGGYTGGESLLDTTLLTRPKDNRERFSQLRDKVTDEVDQFRTDTQANTEAWTEAAQNTTAATQQAYTDDITADQAALDADLAATVEAVNAARNLEYNNALGGAGRERSVFNNPYEAPLDEDAQWAQLAGPVNKDNFIKYGGDLSAEQAATPEQLASYQALANILNNENLMPTTAAASPDAYNFNEAGYNAAKLEQKRLMDQMKAKYEAAKKELIEGVAAAEMYPNKYEVNLSNPLPKNPFGYATVADLLPHVSDEVRQAVEVLQASAEHREEEIRKWREDQEIRAEEERKKAR